MSNEEQTPLTQPELVQLHQMLDEASDSKLRVESETEHQKYIASRAKEELGVPTKRFNQLVKQRYQNKISEEIQEREEVMEFYEQIETASSNQRP